MREEELGGAFTDLDVSFENKSFRENEEESYVKVMEEYI